MMQRKEKPNTHGLGREVIAEVEEIMVENFQM
jgi:hypothetical protein